MKPEMLFWLFGLFWSGNLIFFWIIRSSFNLRFKDPSLTLAQILWSISWVMVLTHFLDDARPAALMLCLLVIIFGAFRLNLAQLAGVCCVATGGYLVVIYFLSRPPRRIRPADGAVHPERICRRSAWFNLRGPRDVHAQIGSSRPESKARAGAG